MGDKVCDWLVVLVIMGVYLVLFDDVDIDVVVLGFNVVFMCVGLFFGVV